jgi:hypothetical protein
LDGKEAKVIEEGILFADDDCFYPVIGIPRLNVEAVIEYADFLHLHLTDCKEEKEKLLKEHGAFLKLTAKKTEKQKNVLCRDGICMIRKKIKYGMQTLKAY